MRPLPSLVFSSIALFAAACSSSATEEPRPTAIELQPNAKVLDDRTLASIVDATPDGAKLTFGPGAAVSIQTGDVLLGGISSKTPHGLLRRVVSVEPGGGGVVVTTERAPLEAAIRRGRIHLERTPLRLKDATVEPAEGIDAKSLRPLAAEDLAKDFTVGVDGVKVTDGVTASASLGFGVAIDLDLNFGNDAPSRLVLSGAESASVTLRALASASFEKKVEIARVVFPPILLNVGVPIVITPQLVLDLGAKGSTGAELAWSASQTAGIDVGVEVSSKGVDPLLVGTASAKADPLQIRDTLDARVWAGITLETWINTAIVLDTTLAVGADGFVDLKADPTKTDCFTASAGVDGRASAEASALFVIPIAKTSATKTLANEPFLKLACSKEPLAVPPWSAAIAPSDLEEAPALAVLPDDSILLSSKSANVTSYLARFAPRGEVVSERKVTSTASVRAIFGDGTTTWIGASLGTVPIVDRAASSGSFRKTVVAASGSPSPTALAYAPTKDGGLAVAGETLDGTYVTWIAKIGGDGALQWSKIYGGIGVPSAIAETSDGGLVVVGERNVAAMVTKVTATGDLVFARSYGEGRIHGVTALSPSGIVAVGQTSTGAGAIVLRLGEEGTAAWSFSYESPTGTSAEYRANAVAARPGGIVVAGRRGFAETSDGWALEVATDGALGWSRTYGGGTADAFVAVRTTGDGGAIFAGESASFGTTRSLFLVRTQPSGAIAFAAGSGAEQRNAAGEKKPVPGAQATLAATVKPYALTLVDVPAKDWVVEPTKAVRKSLAP
jgi:hypothetical protein